MKEFHEIMSNLCKIPVLFFMISIMPGKLLYIIMLQIVQLSLVVYQTVPLNII